MNELCEMVFILDRSGSMHGLESDTIGGFNSMIDSQRKEGVKGFVTTALFDSEIEIPFDRIDIREIPEMTDKIYFTRGTTALFDAVGSLIQRVQNHRRFLTPEQIPGKTIFVITTDGLENASREFSGPAVKGMIEECKEAGWEFLYLGANVDAVSEAAKIGISADRSVRYHADSIGVRKNFAAVGRAVRHLSMEAEPLEESWADEIREDFKSRKSSR